jgi:hypothetical protein
LGQCDTEWYEVMGNIHDVAVEVWVNIKKN